MVGIFHHSVTGNPVTMLTPQNGGDLPSIITDMTAEFSAGVLHSTTSKMRRSFCTPDVITKQDPPHSLIHTAHHLRTI